MKLLLLLPALALLKGECRPAYLTRMTLEQQVRTVMLDKMIDAEKSQVSKARVP